MLDAFVSGGTGYQSEKRLKMRSILGPTKPDDIEDKNQEIDNEQLKQDKLKAYFEEYDKTHRPKSLLEIHQEKKRNSKNQHKEFDSDKLFSTRVDSKKVFSIVGSASNDLSKKFASGKFKNSFM